MIWAGSCLIRSAITPATARGAGADIFLTRLCGQLIPNGCQGDAGRNKYLIDGQGRILADVGEADGE